MKTYLVLGMMSGTSLDGLDLAYCHFSKKQSQWNYTIEKAVTIPYPKEWKKILSELPNKSALEFVRTDADYGAFLGEQAIKFIENERFNPDFLSSHGHTIFHQPDLGYTCQIGSGASIAARSGFDVVCDFRSLDVAYAGQGAPLVPIGDRLLFNSYDFRLNLGGFANISYEENGRTLAFDIAPANIALNHFAAMQGLDFDLNGDIAAKGIIIPDLLEKLNALEYYQVMGAKSLGREWFETIFLPIINTSLEVKDILRTLVEHIAIQVSKVITQTAKHKLLITGGGAYNSTLIKVLSNKTKVEICLPSDELINFKEALIFAFLGVLRWENSINTLKEVTGAKIDSIGGAIYKGKTIS